MKIGINFCHVYRQPFDQWLIDKLDLLTIIMLMLGREITQPVDLMMDTAVANLQISEPTSYVTKLQEAIGHVHNETRQHLKQAQHRQKRDYDLRLQERKFEVGDVVYKVNSAMIVGQSPKLQNQWKGPFLVITEMFPQFKICSQKKVEVVHHDIIQICEGRQLPLWLRRKRHTL